VRFTRARAVRSGHGEATAGQRVLLPAITLNLTFDRTGDIYMSKTTTIRLVFATVASTLALSATAMAADLGGNCCADLEERVAELEATAARKGNRKVSLTVYGQVNEAVIFWNDGQERNAYVVSNNASRTRIGFRGDAKITNDVSAGYLLELGIRYANSSNRNQDANQAGGNASNGVPLDIRHSAWYLDSKSLGRVWVGKTSTATDGITEINLANINSGNADISGWNNGFFLRNNGTLKSGVTWGNLQSGWNNNIGEGDRNNTVRYISPAFAGFTVSSSWSEDDKLDTALRYAGEFNGVRLAAGIGYQKKTDLNNGDGGAGCANPQGLVTGAGSATISNVSCEAIGLSASVMHVPTGIFITGAYGEAKDNNRKALYTGISAAAGNASHDKDKMWSIQAGVEQKWFALGKTTLFGEYIKSNTGSGIGANGGVTNIAAGDALTGVAALIASSEVKTWGLGVNQSIEAANADFYLHFRNFQGSLNTINAAGAPVANTGVKDFQAVMTGMIIRF
jgi:predicted porin